MRSLLPIPATPEHAHSNGDMATYASLVPTVNTWDISTAPIPFSIHVPHGERWLTHFEVESYIAGPNSPTYQIGIGIVLRGATRWEPASINTPGSYWHGITVAGDAAWGSATIPLWLNPGITVCHFGIRRDAGAITVARRQIRASPYLGMKI